MTTTQRAALKMIQNHLEIAAGFAEEFGHVDLHRAVEHALCIAERLQARMPDPRET